MFLAGEPRFRFTVLMNARIGPYQRFCGRFCATSSRAHGINRVEIENRHLNLGCWLGAWGRVHKFDYSRDFGDFTLLWTLRIGQHDREVRQENCACKCKPHQPAFYKHGCNNANNSNCHRKGVFEHARLTLVVRGLANCCDALCFSQRYFQVDRFNTRVRLELR